MITAPGDVRPDDWNSFTELSGNIAETFLQATLAFGSGNFTAPFGIQAGEELGYIDYSAPTLGGILGGPIQASTGSIGYSFPSLPVMVTQPSWGSNPYPDYQGEVTPETHPELYGAPGPIPTPREVYESSIPDVGIPEGEGPPPVFIPIGGGSTTPDPYEQEVQEPMASFWDFVNPIIDVAQGQQPGGTTTTQSAYGPYASGYQFNPAQPTYNIGAFNPTTGTYGCRKRRRRRRLLTEGDFNDLMRIATLPNKQNVTVALAKAVGRR